MKINKKKIAIFAGCLAALVLIPYGCNSYFCWHYEKQAQPVIDLAEQFKDVTGKTPRNAAEMGFVEEPMSTGPFYQRVDSAHYQVFYVDEFNRFYIYDSATRKWRTTENTPGH